MKRSIWAAVFTCALIAALPAKATDFTLSEAAILSLDYDMSHSYSPPLTASITSKQDIPGIGVKFNIHYPSTNAWDCFRFQVSDRNYGNGTLAGIDVSAYSNFVLKFTLVSVDGSSFTSPGFLVGALIGPYSGSGWAFQPKVISLNGGAPVSDISTTAVHTTTLSDIGFVAYEFPGTGWSAGAHDVTLLVQPADGAVQIVPEPATWMLTMLGAGVLFGARRMLRRW